MVLLRVEKGWVHIRIIFIIVMTITWASICQESHEGWTCVLHVRPWRMCLEHKLKSIKIYFLHFAKRDILLHSHDLSSLSDTQSVPIDIHSIERKEFFQFASPIKFVELCLRYFLCVITMLIKILKLFFLSLALSWFFRNVNWLFIWDKFFFLGEISDVSILVIIFRRLSNTASYTWTHYLFDLLIILYYFQ